MLSRQEFDIELKEPRKSPVAFTYHHWVSAKEHLLLQGWDKCMNRWIFVKDLCSHASQIKFIIFFPNNNPWHVIIRVIIFFLQD